MSNCTCGTEEKKYYHLFNRDTKKYLTSGYRTLCVIKSHQSVDYQETEIPVYKEPELEDGWYLVALKDEIGGYKYLRQKIGIQGYDINGDAQRAWDRYLVLKKVTMEDLEEK